MWLNLIVLTQTILQVYSYQHFALYFMGRGLNITATTQLDYTLARNHQKVGPRVKQIAIFDNGVLNKDLSPSIGATGGFRQLSLTRMPLTPSYCKDLKVTALDKNILNKALSPRRHACYTVDRIVAYHQITVFLKALHEYCGDVVNVTTSNWITYDSRHLYEVVISHKRKKEKRDNEKGDKEEEESIPTIIIDAGQLAGQESVGFALYVIEQLVACQEYNEMIQKVKWVIMPCVNPDGMEYSRYERTEWTKNLRLADDEISFGVDISRNFDNQWSACPKVESGFSSIYPGATPASENETLFVKNTLNKYKKNAKIYLSLRRNGHSIAYPYGNSKSSAANSERLAKIAGEVTSKVNMRSNGVHLFANSSIYELIGNNYCGHSVDYAYDLGIPLAFEMRTFLASNNRIMSKFQTMPRGYESSLRHGYFSGIRELYNVITNEKKYGKIV